MKQRHHTDIKKKTRKQLEQENCSLQTLAELDGLTGLYNRITIERKVDDYLSSKQSGTMIVMDLDYFKQVNDRYGHIAGDMLLCTIGNVLKKMFSRPNLVARVGGDEFVIFMPSVLDDSRAIEECSRIQERFREVRLGESIRIKLSITIDSADSRIYRKYKDMFDCADQKVMAKKRLRNLGTDTVLISPDKELVGIEPDMSLIAREMEEKRVDPGAYCQDYDTFKQIYRLEERRLRRERKNAFIILFTLTDKNNGFLPLDKRDAEMEILENEIKQCLRMGDVYTRYSSCQYLVMLLDVAIENESVVAERICDAYYRIHQETADNIILHHSYPLRSARGDTPRSTGSGK